MNFQPNTDVYFSSTGIDHNNKVWCKSEEELAAVCLNGGRLKGVMKNCSFQRADGYYTIRVDHSAIPYYTLLQCDTVLYVNREQEDEFYIFGHITTIEWKNEECSFVSFIIDPFMTYANKIDFDNTYAYIQREHVKDDWSADPDGGGNPLFSNMGPAEDFTVNADTPFYSWTKTFSPDYVVVMSPYDSSANAVFNGANRGNLYTSLQIDILTADEANQRFKQIADKKDATINNVVGVYGVPFEWARIIRNGGLIGGFGGGSHDAQEDIPAIQIAASQLPAMPKYNNAKCWSSPFMTIRLMSSEGQVIDFTPQWLGNDQEAYTVRWRAGGAGGLFGGAQCTLQNKNGAFNWDVWNDFIVSISELPTCPWTGDGFRDYWARNERSTRAAYAAQGQATLNQGIVGAVKGVKGYVSASPVLAASGIADIGNAIASNRANVEKFEAEINNLKASGATVNGIGSFSSLLDIAAESWGFKIIYYCTQEYTLRAIDNFFDRFGYRVNKLKKLELENRPIWTYIQTAECHVVPKTGIPIIYQNQINQMFNSGVTMWKYEKYTGGNQKIGDFSKAAQNRGIKGA